MKCEWKTYQIGDICSSISETYKGKDEYVVLINTSDVLDGKILNHSLTKNANLKGQFKKKFQAKDILYSEIRPANKRFAFVDIEDTHNYIASTKLMVIRANSEIVLPEYLFIFLQMPAVIAELQILAETRSGTFPQITFSSEISPLCINIPDKEIQKRIVHIFRSLDYKIELNNKINENLQQQAITLFDSYYNRANSRVGVTEIIQILGGGTPKTGESSYWNGCIPFFTPKDVGSPYTLSTEKRITEEGLSHCNSRLYPVNTVFVTARGTVGKVGMAGVPMAMNQSCYALVGKEIPPLLVYFYTLKTVERLKHKASGAVFDAITTRDFENEDILKLSETEVEAFLDIAEPIYQVILSNTMENQRLIALRDALLPKLMSGELLPEKGYEQC